MKGFLGCLIKVLFAFIIVGIVALLLLQFAGVSCVRKIDHSLPPIDAVPWEVRTATHMYYAKEVREKSDDVILVGWYERADGKWLKQSIPLVLEKRIYGEITVRRRE